MECWCWKLCFVSLLIYIAAVMPVSSALSNCGEFKVIPPEQYDRNASSVNDINKRPLGYKSATAYNPGIASGENLKNPCALLKNLTGRYVEVLVQTLVSGKLICVRDDRTPTPNKICNQGTISGCWNPSKDTVNYEFYCDPGEGCDADVQFWYRLTPSKVGEDVDNFCLKRAIEFPESLLTVPPPVEKTPVVQRSNAHSLHYCSIVPTFLLLALKFVFSW